MKKDYVAYFQFDGIQPSSKEGVKVIESVMREASATQTVRSIDYDDWIELTFTVGSTFDAMTKMTDKIFERLKKSDLKFSCSISEHTPKLTVKPVDFGSDEKFSVIIEKIYEKNEDLGSKKVALVKEPSDDVLLSMTFTNIQDRDKFKEEYDKMAKEQNVENVTSIIDWDEVPVIQRDSFTFNKKNSAMY